MHYTLEDLQEKSVVNVNDGINFGCVDDVLIDTDTAKIISLVIYGKKKFFGLFGRDPDLMISWDDIKLIGGDVVLISVDNLQNAHLTNGKKNILKQLFR